MASERTAHLASQDAGDDIPGNDDFDYGGGGGGYDDDDIAPVGDAGEQAPAQAGAVAETVRGAGGLHRCWLQEAWSGLVLL